MSFALVAFVAVTLLTESALVLAVLALEVVRARVEVGSLVGKLRVEVCFAAAAAFTLDSTAKRWWREAAGCWRCVVWRDGDSTGRNRNGAWRKVGWWRSEVVVGRREVVVARRARSVAVVDRIRRTRRARVSAAARTRFVVVTVVGHALRWEGGWRGWMF